MKTISRKNLPSRIPIFKVAVIIMALDFYNSPQWLIGMVSTVLALIIIGSIICVYKEKQVDIFKENGVENKLGVPKESSFKQKMDEMTKKEICSPSKP